MKATINDIIEVEQVIALLQHIIDKRDWGRYDEVFTEDASYDCSIFGFKKATGKNGIVELFNLPGHAKAHHTTNTYFNKETDTELHTESKVLAMLDGGILASATYVDKFKATPLGWRVADRVIVYAISS